jgi:hypothetical protein
MATKTFADYLAQSDNWIKTENDANAVDTTGSALLDLFGTVGALRSRPQDVVGLFEKAFSEDPLLATKTSFYARNVRGGLGERLVSRLMWKWLALNHPEIMAKNVGYIPDFGRWDDLYAFMGTEVEAMAWEMIGEQLKEDVKNAADNQPISLLAKWLKSINTSSPQSRALGKLTAQKLGMSERTYRKTLADLRAYINVTETAMSAGKWGNIKYDGVPSKAMANYRKAFGRHDTERFGDFITKVQKGEATIHSGTLYPYDIFEKMGLSFEYAWNNRNHSFSFSTWDAVLEEQWKALPNYVKEGENILVVADTSGSMQGRPICTSIGLGIYFAERNTGVFHNKFITFSEIPNFIELKGKTLEDKIKCVPSIVANTDLEAVFNLVLRAAVNNKAKPEEMPKAIIIISDMEIDSATNEIGTTFNAAMQKKFKAAGYELPNMVYWQVDARQNVFHAEKDEHGVQLASGQSPSVFKAILEGINLTAYDMMVKTLSNPAYDCITI